MTTEHLLDAIGLLDDGLIQEAERYCCPTPQVRSGRRIGLAASFAVALVLGYGLSHLGMGGGLNKSSSAGGAQCTESYGSCSDSITALPAPEEPSAPAGSLEGGGSNAPAEGIFAGDADAGLRPEDAVMADGVLYWSTGEAVSIEPEEGEIRTAVSYTSAVPEMDGQTNFAPDLSAQYVKTEQGLAVLVGGEWILFVP